MPNYKEFRRADDFAEHRIPLASRSASNVYAIHSTNMESQPKSESKSLTNSSERTSTALFNPDEIIVPEAHRHSSFLFSQSLDEMFVGPKCTMTLYITAPIKDALLELKYKRFSGNSHFSSMKTNKSGFITYALADGALNYREWWESVPLDGRSSSSTFSVSSIARRTTFSTFTKVKELIIHTHLAVSENKNDIVSMEAVKLIATTWGLRRLLMQN